jgi:DNA-binding transcriptional MerR regulator
MIGVMTIGELAARSGLSVRTLRFYADSGVLPVAGRAESGYRLFAADAVARARLVRTLRELGVGLDDVKRVLSAEASLADVASAHARALDAQIRTLRLQRAVLSAVARSTDPKELEHMTDLTILTAEQRRRIVDDYLDAVFGDAHGAVAEKIRSGAPELPDDPTADQVAAWVELVELLRDPDYIAASRRMAERALAEGPAPDPEQFDLGKTIGEHAGAAARAGIEPDSPDALEVIERLERMTPGEPQDRTAAADRIEAFNDRRVARYWALVAIVNGWPQLQARSPTDMHDAWEWYAHALRAHAQMSGGSRPGDAAESAT